MQNGASLILGCEPEHFACIDDPEPGKATLSSRGRIFGNLIGQQPLGIVMHDTIISGNVRQNGGGGGKTCEPSGIFAHFESPVYSDYEDMTINGTVGVNRLESSWLGLARLHVNGNVGLVGNQLVDPDAIEMISNTILGNLRCSGNSMVWNSADAGENPFHVSRCRTR